MPLSISTLWFLLGLCVVCGGIYAAGMVMTRKKLARFQDPSVRADGSGSKAPDRDDGDSG